MPSPDEVLKFNLEHLAQAPKELVDAAGNVDMRKVMQILQLDGPHGLMGVMFYLYYTDPYVNFEINRKLIAMAMACIAGINFERLPADVIPLDETAWLAADQYCDKCPGSSYYELIPGRMSLQCRCDGRMERYRDCLKYRDNVREADHAAKQDQKRHLTVYQEFEELANAYFPRDVRLQTQDNGTAGNGPAEPGKGSDAG